MAFPFVEVNPALHPANGGFFKSAGDDFFGAQMVFDVEFENAVEDFIGWQRVLVLLVGPQFRAWWFVDGVPRDDFAFAVDPGC